ncbi:DUF1972 domain-containing protein [Novosphingobium sp. 1949]|uniref:DUF1972 domain-containing protein n=1 Tax=Novosphingobium organovorum TaxID=2930092 RepID=A0ABT0BEA9_9SPHN|nr:DUF1972 domain-containing protein [Novosphingobium organovorum]MCJ2183121.1 DUF1972 domain-containing protein [Novosphingobium organovorum]
MADKHLIILGIRGVPAAHGGFESFAERLVPWMVGCGWDVTVYCQGSETGQRFEDTWEGCRRIHIPIKRDGAVGTIEFDVKSAFDAVDKNAVILTLGYNTGFLSAMLRLRGCFNIINMDGIEWKREKYSLPQKIYLWLNEHIAALSGNKLVADHPEIARHHTRHAKPEKIAMIPYGSDRIAQADATQLDSFGIAPKRFMTVIARPEPENSLLEIVTAFSQKPRGIKLVVLGKYSREHAYQAKVLDAASDEVLFPGAIYDKAIVEALRLESLAYVHGHRVGGTNPSLVEALGAGNAVIAHDNKFNRWVAGDGALYFSDVASCAVAIERLIDSPDLQRELAQNSTRRWEENFTWPMILSDYENLILTSRENS